MEVCGLGLVQLFVNDMKDSMSFSLSTPPSPACGLINVHCQSVIHSSSYHTWIPGRKRNARPPVSIPLSQKSISFFRNLGRHTYTTLVAAGSRVPFRSKGCWDVPSLNNVRIQICYENQTKFCFYTHSRQLYPAVPTFPFSRWLSQ